MATSKCPVSGGIIKREVTKVVNWRTQAPSNSTTCVFDLSDIPGAEDFVLFENMIPVLRQTPHAGNASNITLTWAWAYDAATKKLTLTLGGHTSYVYFSTDGYCGVDIYTTHVS